jgi:hypothetical protein
MIAVVTTDRQRSTNDSTDLSHPSAKLGIACKCLATLTTQQQNSDETNAGGVLSFRRYRHRCHQFLHKPTHPHLKPPTTTSIALKNATLTSPYPPSSTQNRSIAATYTTSYTRSRLCKKRTSVVERIRFLTTPTRTTTTLQT